MDFSEAYTALIVGAVMIVIGLITGHIGEETKSELWEDVSFGFLLSGVINYMIFMSYIVYEFLNTIVQ